MTKPKAYLSAITFSDGTTISTASSDIIVVVGPNNVGKSVALRDIHDKVLSPKNDTQVATNVDVSQSGSVDDLEAWLDETCRRQTQQNNPGNPSYSRLGTTVHKQQAAS